MAVVALGLGILYSALLGLPIATYLPHVAVGLLIWNFVSGCILEGSEVFIANEGLIKFLPAPLTLYVYRLLWRQILSFLHNLVVWVVLMIVFPHPLSWSLLLAIPAFALLCVNGAWVAVLSGILASRFRDIPPIIASLTQLVFYMTPIVWSVDVLGGKEGLTGMAQLVELNPVLHFLEIVREPLLGEPIVIRYWLVASLITVVGWAVALLCLRNYRARVPYWV